MRGCRCAVGTDPTGRDRLAGQARHGQNSATTASLQRDAEQAVCAGPPQRPGQALWRKERPVHTGRPGADEMQTRRRPGTGSSGTGQECTAGAQVRTQAARRQAAVTPDQTFFCGACAGAVRAQTTHGRPGADGMQTRHRPCAGSSGTGQNGQAAWQQTRRSRIRRSPGRSVPDQTERVRPEPKQPASVRSEPDQTEPGRNAGCRNGASCRWILSGSVHQGVRTGSVHQDTARGRLKARAGQQRPADRPLPADKFFWGRKRFFPARAR